ncbi:LytTR family DNA-binding domain-containing protein [uncultured Aquimarina sp.]|uniref:LytR/AlgR family response regulator transcription factor n=1 Tax=uncultured Aquimarina sp. TaxID=575652 RepID=UPI0026291713|nr:LytTR family DNA-binding domain-containing protein [uncultured Aquimarina sp.]
MQKKRDVIMLKIRTIIVDDENNSLEALNILLLKFCPEVAIIGKAENLKKAKKLIDIKKPDLVFLDIHIRDDTIFTLLDSLKEIDFEIIFVTGDEGFALKAFSLKATDYLLKPVSISGLQDAIRRIQEKIIYNRSISDLANDQVDQNVNKGAPKIAFPIQNGFRLVEPHEITHLIADGSYTNIHCTNLNTLLVSRNLKHYEVKLKKYGFFRVHPSVLINLRYLREINRQDGGFLIMDNNKTLPVSNYRRKELEDWIKGDKSINQ